MTGSNTPPKAIVRHKRSISPIWIIPVIALAIGGWLLFKSISEAGTRITIHFANANGIVEGKTPIRYQGLVIGTVRKITIGEGLSGVNVSAEIDFRAAHLLRENTRFWLVSPKATVTGIEGLDALVQGNYISMLPGDGAHTTHFTADTDVPHYLPQEGVLVRLIADDLGSLHVGSGVFYKKIQVGEVYNFSLTDDGRHVIIDTIIEDKHAPLVKRNSRFWNISGISARLDLTGVSFQADSLASVLSGGIAFDSPADAPTAQSDSFFQLYPDQEHAQRGVAIQLQAPLGAGLAVGTRIYYQQQVIGEVTELTPDFSDQQLLASARITPELRPLLTQNSRFRLVRPGFSLAEPASIQSAIGGTKLELHPGDGEPATRFAVIAVDTPSPEELTVRLFADSAAGLKPGSSLWYRGVTIGRVTSIALNSQQDRAELILAINPDQQALIGNDSRFYLYNPVSFNADVKGISLETAPLTSVLDGAIALYNPEPARGQVREHYRLHNTRADARLADKSRRPPYKVHLSARELSSVSVGSPVYYRKLQVGTVDEVTLQADGQIAITLHIAPKYRHLVTDNSVFWNASGIRAEAGLRGISVEMDALTAIAAGGIAFDNTDAHNASQSYRLYADREQAMERPQYLTLTFANGKGIQAGAPIRYRGVAIGSVDQVWVSYDLQQVQARVKLRQHYAGHFARRDARFWIQEANLSLEGASNLSTLIAGPFISALPGIEAATDHVAGLDSAPSQLPADALTLVLHHPTRGSLRQGSPIYFRQLPVGQVDRVHLSDDSTEVLLDIHVDPPFAHLVRQNSVFWKHTGINVEVGFGGASIQTESLESVLKGGISFNTPEMRPGAAASNGTRFRLHEAPQEHWLEWQASLPD